MTRALAVAIPVLALLACGPIGPIPGGPLQGDVKTEPVESWDFAAGEAQIQVETRPGSPYSVNVWCLVVDGRLYVTSGKPEGKRWVRNVLEDESVKVRIGTDIHLARATRVTDAEERSALVPVYVDKYNVPDPDAPDSKRVVWFFRIESRGS